MKLPNIKVWDKRWQPRKKGFNLGFLLGLVIWAIKLDVLLAVSMIPIVVVVGLVFLPMLLGLILTPLVFGLIGYATGYLSERLGKYQGMATAGMVTIVIVGVFLHFYAPGIATGGLPRMQAQMRQVQYAYAPFQTLASVSGRVDPGYISIQYAPGYTQPVQQMICPSHCNFGCFPGTQECKSLGTSQGYDLK